MPRIKAFEAHTQDYETWFDHHPLIYQSELQAIRSILPNVDKSIEIGAGSGRFAGPLNIRYGIEPSPNMTKLAGRHGIQMMRGIAESLPIRDACFEFVLMVTTLCFVDNVMQSFREINRILSPNGYLILGFVDKKSLIGQHYYKNRTNSRFYNDATFYTAEEVFAFLKNTGFHSYEIFQTLFSPLNQINKIETMKPRYGEGSFIVIKAYNKV